MPKDFENCVKRGGKVRTVSGPSKKHGLDKNEYVKYCTIDGKTYRGEVKKKKAKNNNSKENEMDLLNFKSKEIPKKVPKRALWFDEPLEQTISFSGKEGEEKKGQIVGYSGQPMDHWLFGKIAVDVSGVNFGKGKNKFPVLEEHSRERKIGFSKKPITDDNKLVIDEFTVLDNPVANEFYDNAKKGYPYQASISIKPLKIEELSEKSEADVNGIKLKGPALIIRQSEYRETSVCTFGADSNTSVSAFSDNEEFEELDIEVVSHYNEGNTHQEEKESQEVNKMDLKEFKEKYPDLVKEFTDEVKKTVQDEFSSQITEKDKEIETLKKEKENLSNNNTELSDRVQQLERKDIVRTEREIKASAKHIVDSHLAGTDFSDRIKEKIRGQFNYEKFVKDDKFDEAAFTEHVKSEISDWAESLKDTASSVSGVGFTQDNRGSGDNFSDQEADSLADRMVNYVEKAE
ncbi:MAG: hypothetical protein ACOC80_05025 [Petrotogales bacterium]